MRRRRDSARAWPVLAAVGLVAGAGGAGARPRAPLDAGGLAVALERLEVVGAALYVAAHPDDENTALLAWLIRGRKVDAAYLSLTRGEGGQNLIGAEQGPLVGVIRTQELLAARGIDRAEQRFTRAPDFGFSKSAEETLGVWQREAVLGDIVWAIRRFQPDVVLTRFPKVNPETHGHHTASARLAEEAFQAASDPRRFPEQLAHVAPWRPARLCFNDFRPQLEGRPADAPPLLQVDLGTYEPRLGRSFSEIAAESRSQHKSQGFGSLARRGTIPDFFELLAGDPLPPGASDLFAGLDLGWSRLKGGGAVARHLAEARRVFRPEAPQAVVAPLVAALAALDDLAPSPRTAAKRREMLEVVRSACGLWLEAVADRHAVIPGGVLKVTTLALNRSPLPLALAAVDLAGAATAVTAQASGALRQLQANVAVSDEWQVSLPADLPLTHPYWLDGLAAAGGEPPPELRGLPESPPALVARFTVEIPGEPPARLEFTEPIAYRFTDPVAGERWRPVEVLPEVAVALDSQVYVFPSAAAKSVRVRVSGRKASSAGQVRLLLPEGFRAEPASQPFTLGAAGDEQWVSFTVTPPAAAASGEVAAEAEAGASTFTRQVIHIEHPHIPVQTLTPPARARLVRVDVAGPRPRIGYVMGAGDDVPQALRQAGYEVTLLEDAALDGGDLSGFGAIVLGVRALNTRERLRTLHPRLLAWVEAGGTLVVQYATSRGLVTDAVGPWPLVIGRERVTVEDAPVRFALADHRLLVWPNRLGPADFAGWVQERGLYFAETFDARYQAPLAMADPGEGEKLGSLLHAGHGSGVFIYSGLAFFRQLPAGVPGAYRLFANLLAAGQPADSATR